MHLPYRVILCRSVCVFAALAFSTFLSAQAVVSLSPTSVSFGNQQVGIASTAQVVTLTNTGNASLSITGIKIASTKTADFSETNTCPSSLAANASCTISVTFKPTKTGNRSSTVKLTDNAAGSPQTVPVSGTGVAPAVTLTPVGLSFAGVLVGTSSTASPVTVTNSGTANLTISSIVATGDFSQTNNCPVSLNPGTNCTVSVTFTPSFTGTRSGYITVNDTAASFLQTVNLNGTGTLANALVNIDPGQASLTPSQLQQFTATLSGGTATFTWAVDGVVGGNSTVGTISASGLYTPPTIPAMHTIQATNVSNPLQKAVAFVAANNYPGTFTGRNDTLRTGQNLNEVALTTGTVNRNQFGKLFSYPVDGYVFAQPLYVEGVNIRNQGIHNVVYVATESDTVFAFDADNNGTGGGQLWQQSFTDS